MNKGELWVWQLLFLLNQEVTTQKKNLLTPSFFFYSGTKEFSAIHFLFFFSLSPRENSNSGKNSLITHSAPCDTFSAHTDFNIYCDVPVEQMKWALKHVHTHTVHTPCVSHAARSCWCVISSLHLLPETSGSWFSAVCWHVLSAAGRWLTAGPGGAEREEIQQKTL